MAVNGYLQKKAIADNVKKRAWEETITQYIADCFFLALNDPDVMGKDVLGETRLLRVRDGVERIHHDYILALSTKAEADYIREKLDENLSGCCGDWFMPFQKRYPWINEISYNQKR